jgi:hypothetical protein
MSVVGDRSRISAAVESPRWSTPRNVWFEMPSQYLPAEPALSGDAWLAALLLPAMRIRATSE